MKLVTKLTLFTLLSKLAIACLFVLILPALVERISSRYTNYQLKQQEKKVLKNIAEKGIDHYMQGEASYGSYTMLLEEYISLEPAANTVTIDTIQTTERIIESDTLTYRVLSKVFQYNGRSYLLEIGKTTSTISQYHRPLQRLAIFALITLIVLTLLADLLYMRYLMRPLRSIIETKLLKQQFPFNEATAPIETSTADFQYLDRSLMSLMGQVHQAFEKEREFTSNASHELLTPISILQSKIDNLIIDTGTNEKTQEKLIGMVTTLNRLKRIVNSLLLISRIENDQYVRHETVQLETLIADVVTELEHRMEEKQITFHLNLQKPTSITNVNRDLLFQLFYNLINNAIRYNVQGGRIIVTESLDATGEYILSIADTGGGIEESQLPFIFNRFRKGRKSGDGIGLGLSIVQSIAKFHEIDVSIHSTGKKKREDVNRLKETVLLQVSTTTTVHLRFNRSWVELQSVSQTL